MGKNKRVFTAEYKAKVTEEATRGEVTLTPTFAIQNFDERKLREIRKF